MLHGNSTKQLFSLIEHRNAKFSLCIQIFLAKKNEFLNNNNENKKASNELQNNKTTKLQQVHTHNLFFKIQIKKTYTKALQHVHCTLTNDLPYQSSAIRKNTLSWFLCSVWFFAPFFFFSNFFYFPVVAGFIFVHFFLKRKIRSKLSTQWMFFYVGRTQGEKFNQSL